MFITSRFAGAAALAALISLVPLSQALAKDLVGRLDEAWKNAVEDEEGILTPQQTTQLRDVAYQAAAARVCDGINLNEDKYAAAVNQLIADQGDKFSDEQEMTRLSHVLVSLGTSYGLFLAEGNIDKAQFCKEAFEAKADTSMANLWE